MPAKRWSSISSHDIKAKKPVEIDDELMKKLLPGDENATLEKLEKEVKEQIRSEN
ncbi:hypothetical protein NNO_0089 [Hydrogenimonas sp.]|nr:hypothetical protein NNO_0089 [Hydrogenimonas sp.]